MKWAAAAAAAGRGDGLGGSGQKGVLMKEWGGGFEGW